MPKKFCKAVTNIFSMNFEARRQAFKKGVDATSAFEHRKQQTQRIRQQQKAEAARERRAIQPSVLFGVPQTSALEMFGFWSEKLNKGEAAEVDVVRLQMIHFVSTPCSLSQAEQCAFMQAALLAAQNCAGKLMVPLVNCMISAFKGSDAEMIRNATLFLITILENDGDDFVNQTLWDHPEDPVGLVMATFATHSHVLQKVLVLFLKTMLIVRNCARIVRVLPFVCAMMNSGNSELCCMALDLSHDLSTCATLEELQLFNDCGIIRFCVDLIGACTEDNARCVSFALNVMDVFAEFSDQTDAPSFWILSAGVLPALTSLVAKEWLDDMYADVISRTVANLAVTCADAVLFHCNLGSAIISYIFEESIDENSREEALNFLLNLVKLPGLDAVRAQTICDMHGLEALVEAANTLATSNNVLRCDIFSCIKEFLNANPVHANDFAEFGGVKLLMATSMTSEGYLQTVCMSILSQHYPTVFKS